MIYILSGNDIKKKNIYLKKLKKGDLPFFVYRPGVSKEEIFERARSVSLFGESPIVVLENVVKEGKLDLSQDEISSLQDSKTVFVFLEDKFLAPEIKKYKKYATIEDFNIEIKKAVPKMNVFGIADSFSRKDKIGAWILYREAILQGISPEEISGIIFWKIKTMILTDTKVFSLSELKKLSSEIVAMYHQAHRGECDFTIGLEQFILLSLNK